ncbi:MAG TPA: hypothetical protein VIU63_02785 [Nitrospira sp.]
MGDTQITELTGRHWLIGQLLQAKLEVATPARDKHIDLIAYSVRPFVARPIQVKAATAESFSVQKKYKKVPNLLLAYVWHIKDPRETRTYAMTYREAVGIATKMGWTKTPSWKKEKGWYTNNKPGRELCRLLEKYKMSPVAWRKKVVSSPPSVK